MLLYGIVSIEVEKANVANFPRRKQYKVKMTFKS